MTLWVDMIHQKGVLIYRNSYFNLKEYNTLLVIGGGDWAKDIMVSVSLNKKVSIRNPLDLGNIFISVKVVNGSYIAKYRLDSFTKMLSAGIIIDVVLDIRKNSWRTFQKV